MTSRDETRSDETRSDETGSDETRSDGTSEHGSYLEVLRTGPLSLFQDLGRVGLAAMGVGRSGAADRSSYLAVNALLGNDSGSAAIECVLGGLSVRAHGDVVVALGGAPVALTVDGDPADTRGPVDLRDGQVVKLGTPKRGLRSYLAVRGGFDVPAVLGSCSTDTLSKVGPAPIARGDRIGVRPGPAASPAAQPVPQEQLGADASDPLLLRVIPGPRDDWFTAPADLGVGEWIVSPHSNRVGVRFDRAPGTDQAGAPALRRKDSRELQSEGVTLGAIQVPPSGQPVLFLADHPVTGGYPVIGVVRDADVDRAAQARPGQRVRFQWDA